MFLACKNICWSLFFLYFTLNHHYAVAGALLGAFLNWWWMYWNATGTWLRMREPRWISEDGEGRHTMSSALRFLLFSSLLCCCCCCRLSAMSDWKEATSRWQSPDNRNRQKKLCTWLHPLFTPVIILLFKQINNKNRTNFKSNFTLK